MCKALGAQILPIREECHENDACREAYGNKPHISAEFVPIFKNKPYADSTHERIPEIIKDYKIFAKRYHIVKRSIRYPIIGIPAYVMFEHEKRDKVYRQIERPESVPVFFEYFLFHFRPPLIL